MKKIPKCFQILLVLCMLSQSIVITKAKDSSESTPLESAIFDGMQAFSNTLDVVLKKHYNPKNIEKGFDKAINAFLQEQDPHSGHLNKEIYTNMMQSTSGQFYGIGVIIDNTRTENDPGLLIIDVIPEGPADKAGIRQHDKIVEIEGESLVGMSTEEAISKIKGERQTKVNLKIMREDAPDLIELAVERDTVKEQNLLSFYIPEHDMLYVSLTTFSENGAQEIKKALSKTNNKTKALILDLRNNTGGLLDAAINIAGLFVPESSLIVQTKKVDGTVVDEYHTRRKPLANLTMPILILINNYTASAAEIIAGALSIISNRHHISEKATQDDIPSIPYIFTVGTQTFGKGSVQEVIPLNGVDSALKITSYLYYLPEDTCIQATGVTPDFPIERMLKQTEQMKWLRKHFGRESAFSQHLVASDVSTEITKKEDESPTDKHLPWAERMKKALQQDNQFKACVGIGNAIDWITNHCPIIQGSRDELLSILQTMFIGDKPLELEQQD